MSYPSIIVVEDDPDIRETFVILIEGEGYPVRGFANGKAAMDGLRGCESPCLILLDLMMPVMNGWEFLKERKRLGDTIVSIPVVLVSAMSDHASAVAAGAEGYLRKPVDVDALLRLVRLHCGPPRLAA
jgi:CheY-like chemotaxis protein